MKYCKITTISHPVSLSHNECLEHISNILQRESTECIDCTFPIFDKENTVINLDKTEAIKAEIEKRTRNKSMDFAFGIVDSNSTVKEILMIELRLNYKNPNNLSKTELEGKVSGSISILKDNIPIHNKYIFIFKTSQISEAENRLFRMRPSINSNYIVMDVDKLKEMYF